MSIRTELKAAIDDAKDTLDALLAAYDTGNDADMRFLAQRQMPTDMYRLANKLGKAVAERVA